MEDDQTSSELSHGSEARPNTPFADPMAELGEDNREYAATTKDTAIQLWIPQDNASAKNHSRPTKPQLSYNYRPTKQKMLPNLSPLTERKSENQIHGSGNGGKKMKNKVEKRLKNSLQITEENDQGSFENETCSKSVVALPKIDTYCISYVRPSTNHGFSYAVSSTELLSGKDGTSRKTKRQKTTLELNAENRFSQQGKMYLLFRAPSRACGLNIPALTIRARPKDMHYLKGTKQLKKPKAAAQTNIVRLPDINEDIWK
jgi:hypothetical protein